MIENYKEPILKNLGLIAIIMGVLKLGFLGLSFAGIHNFNPLFWSLNIGNLSYNLSWTLDIGSYNRILSQTPNILLIIMLIYGGVTYSNRSKRNSVISSSYLDDLVKEEIESENNLFTSNKNRLLKFVFSTLCIIRLSYVVNSPISFANNFYRNFENLDSIRSHVWHKSLIRVQTLTVFNIIESMIYAYVLYKIVTWLSSEDKIIVNERKTESGRIFKSPSHKSKMDRFTHRLIDYILAVLIFSPLIYQLTTLIANTFPSLGHSVFSFKSYFLILAVFIFYFISEAIFKRTPTKYFTGTIVCDKKTHEKASTAKILGRTFARLIPFDALSFFGAEGWHDTVSGTVLNKVDDGNNEETGYWVWLVLFITLFILALLIIKFVPGARYF